MRKASVRFHQAEHLGIGRENQEDRHLCVPDRGLFVIVDGMGGHSDGEMAAQIAVNTIDRVCVGRPSRELLARAFEVTNREIVAYGDQQGYSDDKKPGCVATACWINLDYPPGCVFIAHCGDTRAWRFQSDGNGFRLTTDHGLTDDLPERLALESNQRHVVTHHLGTRQDVADWVEYNETFLPAGELLLLVTDGVSDYLNMAALANVVQRTWLLGVEGIVEEVAHQSLQLQRAKGSGDNIDVIGVFR